MLARREWAEHKITFLLFWVVVSGLTLLSSLLFTHMNSYPFHFLLFIFSGCLMTAILLSRWKSESEETLQVLLPVHAGDKFMMVLNMSLVFFVPVYAVNYFIFHTWIPAMLEFSPPGGDGSYGSETIRLIRDAFSYRFSTYMAILIPFVCCQSVFMIVFFRYRKYAWFFFILIIFVIPFGYNLLTKLIMDSMVTLPRWIVSVPGFRLFFDPGIGLQDIRGFGYGKTLEYFIFRDWVRNLNALVWLVVFALFYLSAFFRMKERQS